VPSTADSVDSPAVPLSETLTTEPGESGSTSTSGADSVDLLETTWVAVSGADSVDLLEMTAVSGADSVDELAEMTPVAGCTENTHSLLPFSTLLGDKLNAYSKEDCSK